MCGVGDAPGLRISCLQSQILHKSIQPRQFLRMDFIAFSCTSLPWQCSWKHPSLTVPLQRLCFEIFPSHCKFCTCTWAQLHNRGELQEIIALLQNLVSCLESMFRHQRCTHDIKAVQIIESNIVTFDDTVF